MAKSNIIQRIIRLVFDRSAAKKAEADSKKAVGGVDKALGGLKAGAIAAGAAIAAAFAFKKIIAGIKDLVRASDEADRIWNRLRGTVESVGVSYGGVQNSLVATARAMQDTTRFGDEQFADTSANAHLGQSGF